MGLDSSRATRELIRERIDMVQLVNEYVPGGLQARGQDDHWGRCPFHEEKSASFHITPSRGFYKCFGCGKGGDVFRFLEEKEGLTFPEALRRLAERTGVKLESASPEERARDARRAGLLRATEQVAAFYERVLWSPTPIGEKGRKLLATRGITEETARAFRLGVAPDGWSTLPQLARERDVPIQALVELGLLRMKDGGRPYDFFRDRFMFPISDEQGKVIAFGGRTMADDPRKYMNSPEVPGIYEKRRVLYGLDKAKKERPKQLVVVEGYVDVVVPHQAGHRNVVASLGTALTPDQAKLARRYVDEVVLLFDGDEAGAAANQKALANLVGEAGLTVKVARLPDGLDPDDAVRKEPGLLEKILAEADDLIGFLIQETLRGWDASSAQGRERAIRAAIRLLGRVPRDNSILFFTELNKVAERFGIPEGVLRDETARARDEVDRGAKKGNGRAPAPGSAPVRPAVAEIKNDIEGKLLEALLAVPDAAAQVAATGVGPDAWTDGAARRVARAVFAIAAEGVAVDPAGVLARLDDEASRDLASRLIGRLDAGKNYVKELEGVGALIARTHERRLQEITREMRQTKDPQATERLLAEHKKLKTEIDEARSRTVAKAR